MVNEGTIQAASRKLSVTPSTISTQLKALEERLGHALFDRVGRRLELTEQGRVVMRYATEIFSLGREMTDTLAGRETGKPQRLRVGAAMVVPKRMVYRLLESALEGENVRLICTENRPDRLLAELALHTLDVVLTDSPIPSGSTVRAFKPPAGELRYGGVWAPRPGEGARQRLAGRAGRRRRCCYRPIMPRRAEGWSGGFAATACIRSSSVSFRTAP